MLSRLLIVLAVVGVLGIAVAAIMSNTACLQVEVRPVPDVPVLSFPTPCATTDEDTSVVITWDMMIATARIESVDGPINPATVGFRIDKVLVGTATHTDGTPLMPGTIIRPGDSFSYLPPPNANGLINAFDITVVIAQ